MQMLKKIFNSDNKYYLELDEIEASKPVQKAIATAEKVANVVQEKTADAIESKPVQQALKTTKETVDTAQQKLQSAADTEAKPKSKSNKKESKKQTADSAEESAAEAKPSPKDAGASSFDPPFWVAAMYKNSSSSVNSDGTKAEQTFATDNLMPVVTKYRRRPGPSLNKFKDMASKAKTPKG
ncbi:MAG: hypothetical protein AAGE96_12480 [Cyanobacteria bacterium P01_G01_bin.19]